MIDDPDIWSASVSRGRDLDGSQQALDPGIEHRRVVMLVDQRPGGAPSDSGAHRPLGSRSTNCLRRCIQAAIAKLKRNGRSAPKASSAGRPGLSRCRRQIVG
jgi:hypothetical protein